MMTTATVNRPEVREMLWRLISSYREEGGRKVASIIGTSYQNVQRWALEGVHPEPQWRTRIATVYDEWKLNGLDDAVPEESGRVSELPRTGKAFPSAVLCTLIDIVTDKGRAYGKAEFGDFGETAFVPGTHIDRIEAAGGAIGSKFWARIEETIHPSSSYKWQVSATDIFF